MPVRVGTSGWSYDDWEGRVYPRAISPPERLPFMAGQLPTIEVDSTSYRDPAPGLVKGWIERTRGFPGFELSVKAPQPLTQDAMTEAAPAEVAQMTADWAAKVARPLHDAGRLGAVLLQLSPGVLRNAPTLRRLDAALEALRGLTSAVEFRNVSWVDEGRLDAEAVKLLDAHGAAAVVVDGPCFPTIVPREAAPHAYVRMHGRNADVWFKGVPPGDARLDRYDYEYSERELRPLAALTAGAAREKEDVRVYFNNHAYGKAFRNAIAFQDLLESEGAAVSRAYSPQRRLF